MKVIHFCGDSGVGKKTLLRNIWDIKAKMSNGRLTAPDQSLLDRLEIEGRFHIWGPYKCKNVPREHKNVESIWEDMKSDIESGEYQTLIHHWQKCTNGIFKLVHELNANIPQKVLLFWRHPKQHLKEYEKRCKDAQKAFKKSDSEKTREQIGFYCNRDEDFLRNKFANVRYPGFVNEEMRNMGIDTEVLELQGEVDTETGTIINPSFRTIVEPELSQLIKV